MTGLPQLQNLNLRGIDRAVQMDRLMEGAMNGYRQPSQRDEFFRAWVESGAPLESADYAYSAWAAKQPRVASPTSDNDSWLSNGTAGLLGSLVSGYFGSRAAGRATDAQLAADQAAMGEQRRQYDQTRADLAPYRERAAPVRNQLAVMMGLRPDASTYTADTGNYQQDPSFNSGYRTAPTYAPGESANALSRYLRPLSNGGR